MRCVIFVLALLFLTSINLIAQQKDTIYYNKDWEKLTHKKDPQIEYFTVSQYQNEKTILIEETFFITGEKQAEMRFKVGINKYTDKEEYTNIGLATSWYKNGQMKHQHNYGTGKQEGADTHWFEDGTIAHQSFYKDGKKDGDAIDFYKGGNKRRIERFENNSLMVGKYFTQTGADTVYFPDEEAPVFSGGEPGIIKFLMQNIQYPKRDLRKGIKGLVVVQFVIDKAGNISDKQIVKHVSPAIDAESLRVVGLMSGKFKPARQEGKPVSYRFTLPIRFAYN